MISKQTTLDLNGPIIEFTTIPSSIIRICPGDSFSITGIATVSFLDQPSGTPINPAVATGTLTYQWYEVVDGSYVPLSDNSNISGAGTTTLTFSNVDETYREKRYAIGASYTPSAYAQPSGSAVTVGTARSTGDALNEPEFARTTGIVIVEVNVGSTLSITQQISPSSATVGYGDGVSATFSIQASVSDNSVVSYQWYVNDVRLFDGAGISGSTTNTLTISPEIEGTVFIYCEVASPTACNAPLRSETATLTVVAPRNVVNIEYIPNGGDSSTRARLESVDLNNVTEYTFFPSNSSSGTDIMSFYAPERDVAVEMDLYGSAGAGRGAYAGGAGGYSRIRLTLEKNVEYVIAPFKYDVLSELQAIFLYKKAKLIAAVGAGGGAGEMGNGGAGGGIGKSGESGRLGSKIGTSGGAVVSTGALPSTGISGSNSYEPDLCCGDTQADPGVGGRVLPCTRGDATSRALYSSCSDIGNSVQFRLANASTPVSNTAFIQRGFKAGYALRNTAGSAGDAKAGGGGEGATGGNGGGIGVLINEGTYSWNFGTQRENDYRSGQIGPEFTSYTLVQVYGNYYWDKAYSNLTTNISILQAGSGAPVASFNNYGQSGAFSYRVPLFTSGRYYVFVQATSQLGSVFEYVTSYGSLTIVGQVGAAPLGGGGGGSGYTDGSVTVISSISGSNNGAAKVIMRI